MLSAQYIIEENAKMNGIRFLFDEENSFEWTAELLTVYHNEVFFNRYEEGQELIYIAQGQGGVTVNGEGFLVRAGNLLLIPKKNIRSVANVEEEALEVMLFKLPSILKSCKSA
jgi:quercetin dioxygenase-like cupin family protein